MEAPARTRAGAVGGGSRRGDAGAEALVDLGALAAQRVERAKSLAAMADEEPVVFWVHRTSGDKLWDEPPAADLAQYPTSAGRGG